ncbi:neuronal acetylcholine receptor subunit alpha-3-like [Mercenaria mercenaria]|uniref:neuronal acetylcholine receptor subunit alpha-3-like n=1 Tax=Mercenaria mercenaria TaxID=6596 RepID=UPI00234F67F8|nr:neuronal acetylcholine receptor subunit alpha-3-like [Mercenaria mercenaria]
MKFDRRCLKISVGGSRGHSLTVLRKQLFEDYYADVRPVLNHSQPIVVTINLTLLKIQQVDEVRQSLKTTVNLLLSWSDELLIWNKSEHDGITNFVFPYDKNIWVPDIMVSNALDRPAELGLNDAYISLKYLGEVVVWTQVNFDTSCEIRTKKYPFDEQHCEILFTKFMNEDDKLILKATENKTNLEMYMETAEWQIVDNFVEYDIDIYETNIGVLNYTVLHYHLKLRRTCMSCILNIMVPVLVLACLNLLTFFVPCESGEKTSFPISIFLTLAVFLTMITLSLPESIDGVSYLSTYVTFQLIMSTITLICTVISLQLHHKMNNRPVPKIGLAIMKVFKCKRNLYPTAKQNEIKLEADDASNDLHQLDRSDSTVYIQRRSSKLWQNVVDAFDTMMFSILLICEIITTVIFLGLILN